MQSFDHMPDLRTSLWVEAHVRTCFTADMPVFVTARGDADRGGVLLKVNRFKDGIILYERTRDFDGNRVWRQLAQTDDERDIDARIHKKRSFDEDLWVVEVEDLRCHYVPDAPVLTD